MSLDGAVVLSEREFLHVGAVASEPVEKPAVIAGGQVCDGQYAVGLEALLGLGADAREGSDGQGREEGDLLAGRDDGEAVGLFEVGGYLGDGLAYAGANGDGQAELALDAMFESAAMSAGARSSATEWVTSR